MNTIINTLARLFALVVVGGGTTLFIGAVRNLVVWDWDWNPGHWSIWLRALLALLLVVQAYEAWRVNLDD